MITKKEAVKWLTNLKSDIGKGEFSALWNYEQGLAEIIEMLERPEPEWIPCDERLPDKAGVYEVTCLYFTPVYDGTTGKYIREDIMYHVEHRKFSLFNGWMCLFHPTKKEENQKRIIAWRRKPEPYNRQNKDELRKEVEHVREKYLVADTNGVLARGMSLDDALMFMKAYCEKYYMEDIDLDLQEDKA